MDGLYDGPSVKDEESVAERSTALEEGSLTADCVAEIVTAPGVAIAESHALQGEDGAGGSTSPMRDLVERDRVLGEDIAKRSLFPGEGTAGVVQAHEEHADVISSIETKYGTTAYAGDVALVSESRQDDSISANDTDENGAKFQGALNSQDEEEIHAGSPVSDSAPGCDEDMPRDTGETSALIDQSVPDEAEPYHPEETNIDSPMSSPRGNQDPSTDTDTCTADPSTTVASNIVGSSPVTSGHHCAEGEATNEEPADENDATTACVILSDLSLSCRVSGDKSESPADDSIYEPVSPQPSLELIGDDVDLCGKVDQDNNNGVVRGSTDLDNVNGPFNTGADLIAEEMDCKIKELKYLVTSRDLIGLERYLDDNEQSLMHIFHCSNEQKESITTMASTLGLVDVIKMFDKKNVLFNVQDGDGYYPIHRAAYNHHVCLVEHLVQCFGDSTLLDCTKNGFNVLHISASIGNVELIRVLSPLIPDINMHCQKGWNALHIATHGGFVEAVEILLENGAKVDDLNWDGHTPLILATERNHREVVGVLLQHGACVDFRNKAGVSALYMAVQTGSITLVNLLLSHGANVNIQDHYGWCALHKATFMENEELLVLLMSKGANPNTQNMKGVTCLHLCASKVKEKGADLAERLLKHGADCNVRDMRGLTPFLLAVGRDDTELVAVMSRHGADVTLLDNQQCSPLYIASMTGSFAMVDCLMRGGASVNQACVEGWTPLLIAVKQGHKLIADMLLDAGADLNKANQCGVTPLALAAKEGTSDMLKIAYSATPTSLYKVACLCDVTLLERLQHVGVCLHMANTLGMTSLHIAAQEGSAEAMNTLLACSGAQVMLHHKDTEGNTPLHIACLHGHVTLVRALTNADPETNITNKAGERCLHLAAKSGVKKVVDILLNNGAYVNATDNLKRTALYHALMNGSTLIFKSLLHVGARVPASAENGLWPIHIAADRGYTEILLLLIDAGAKVNATASFRNTSLHLAAKNGHLETVLELLVRKADANAENVLGKKALHLAAYHGHSGVVEALLSAGTKLELLGDDGSPLYDLSRNEGIWSLIKSWISRTMPPNSRQFGGASNNQWTQRQLTSPASRSRQNGAANETQTGSHRSSVPSYASNNQGRNDTLETARTRYLRSRGNVVRFDPTPRLITPAQDGSVLRRIIRTPRNTSFNCD